MTDQTKCKTFRVVRHVFFLLVLIVAISPCRGEITKGFTNILLEPNGGVSFSLTNGVEIICGIPGEKFVKMIVYFPSTKEYFDGTKKLSKGDVLTDTTGNKVCRILSNSVEYMPMKSMTNKYSIRLVGYISLGNIQDKSIPENVLKELINSNKNALAFNDLRNFIQRFHFYEIKDFMHSKKYYCYLYYADYFWENNIHLVFENQKLIAVLHTRQLELSNMENFKTGREELLWLKTNSDIERKMFIETYKKIYERGE